MSNYSVIIPALPWSSTYISTIVKKMSLVECENMKNLIVTQLYLNYKGK